MNRKLLLWLALGAGSYYLWRQGKLRLTPGTRFVQTKPGATPEKLLKVYHTGSIDIPMDTVTAIINTAIKRISPF